MILGDTNPSTLATNLQFLFHPWPQIRIESKVQTGVFSSASDCLNSMARIEYLGKDSTISLVLNSKPKRDSGQVTIGSLHSFNNNFCAGAQLLTAWSSQTRMQASIALAARYVYNKIDGKKPLNSQSESFFYFICRSSLFQFPCLRYHQSRDSNRTIRWPLYVRSINNQTNKNFPLSRVRFLSNSLLTHSCNLHGFPICFHFRYSFHKSSLATTLSKDALDVSFWHQPSDLLQLGGSFAFNNRTSKAVGSVCYQLEMKEAIVKGMIDSDWSVGCTYNR